MSQGEVGALFKAAVILPFPFVIAFAAVGGVARIRKMLGVTYAILAAGFNLSLLNGFLSVPGEPGWGVFNLTRFSFPLFLILNLTTAAAVLYAAFRKETPFPGLLLSGIVAASGLGALALISKGLVVQVFLWEGVTAAAVLGLVSSGGSGLRRRLVAFIPWLLADALFIAGVIMCTIFFAETAVFIEPPLASGSEIQATLVGAIFLLSALMRLGVFPFQFWIKDLLARTDAAWSAFFLGAVNYMLAGMRAVAAAVFLGRLVASDWGLAIVLVGLFSVTAGPLIALNSETVPGYVTGMYTLQAGILVIGLGLFSRAGLEGALFCMLVSPLFLTAAIMASGTAESLRGTVGFHRQGLSARAAPAVFIVLMLSGMSLAGLPPLDGFVGKALVALANLDKSVVAPFGALSAAILLGACALATLALVRALSEVFAPAEPKMPALHKPSAVEGAAALSLCGGSLLIGIFPGLILRNFTTPGSQILFSPGFSGPGVTIHGIGATAQRALLQYADWVPDVTAFVVIAAVISLTLYFVSRARHPSDGPAGRFDPFLGGALGEYKDSVGIGGVQGTFGIRRGRWDR